MFFCPFWDPDGRWEARVAFVDTTLIRRIHPQGAEAPEQYPVLILTLCGFHFLICVFPVLFFLTRGPNFGQTWTPEGQIWGREAFKKLPGGGTLHSDPV